MEELSGVFKEYHVNGKTYKPYCDPEGIVFPVIVSKDGQSVIGYQGIPSDVLKEFIRNNFWVEEK